MSTRVLTAHIPEELAEKVDRYAESMERSRAWIVKQALARWVTREEEKTRLSLEALEEADRIGTVAHEDMLAWAESLDTDIAVAHASQAMRVLWTSRASSDVVRLDRFLRPKNLRAAARVVRMLLSAPSRLAEHPRLGEQVEGTGAVELRRLLVDDYEIQYEVRSDEVRIARVFHMLEDR